MDLKIKGRRALVTGGSRGIGRECALSLAREGASVAINYVSNDEAAARTLADLQALGVRAQAMKADVTNAQAVVHLVEEVQVALGGIDILVHSAGVNFPSEDPEEWDRLLRYHLYSTTYLCRAVAAVMKPQGWGRIIVISSLANRFPSASAYGVGKVSQSFYVRGLAQTLGPHNITVNVVSPGRINTDMIPGTKEDWIAFAREHTPLYRNRDDYPGPDLVGDVVAFLASEPARHISGVDLPVCGAETVGM